MVNERADGYDSVEWVSRQPWCDGRVGMWGESYYGYTSLAAAVEAPPALLCIAPGDIATERRKIWLRGGAFPLNTIGAWAIAMDAPEYADLGRIDWWHLPLAGIPAAAGCEGGFLKRMIEHADDPAWWAERSLRDRLDRIGIPVLFWSGWYDNYTGEQLQDFAILERASAHPETVHLLVGPWDHEGTAGDVGRAVCVDVPPTQQHRWDTYQAFFDRYLMGIDNGFGSAGKVQYFTIGANRWRAAASWPPPGIRQTPFYLRAGGRLAPAMPEGAEAPDRYCYDPADPVVETVGRNCWALCTQLGDRREIERRDDVICYTTEPLDRDVEITGPITAILYAASSAVDTDFTVALIDVFEDGTANQIQDGIIRAAYRDGGRRAPPLVPDRVYEYRIDMFATSYLVKAGHRIRVDVSSSCFDRYDRNTNSGERFGHAVEIRVAEQSIEHSKDHPSHILLPVVGQ
jgi:hypothetical protein